MLSPAMSPVESPSVATAILGALRAPPSTLWIGGRQRCAVKMGLFYSRKIYDYNYKESPPNIKVIRKPIDLQESRVRGLVVQGEDESPPVHPTCGKLHFCLIVFFLS